MEKEKVVEFLDEVVTALNTLSGVVKKYGIQTCGTHNDFHIYKGIYEICDAINVEPNKEFSDSRDFVYVWFIYKGIKFFELFRFKDSHDVNSVELIFEEDESVGIFKEMDKIVKDFDEATNYTHKDSGVLGEV